MKKHYLLMVLFLLCLSNTANAQWNGNPDVANNLISNALTTDEFQESVTDGSGGAIIVWIGSAHSIYAQHITANGETNWRATTRPVLIYTTNTGAYPQINDLQPDGHGGAYVIWQTRYNATDSIADIYLQRISNTGEKLFPDSGIKINPSNAHFHTHARICTDDKGVIVAWTDQVTDTSNADFPSYAQVFARHYDLTGAPQWGDTAIQLSTEKGIRKTPAIVSDGNGGAYIAFSDARNAVTDENGSLQNMDIYAQHIDINGSLLWNIGLVVSDEPFNQFVPDDPLLLCKNAMIPDGLGGFILVYRDYQSDNHATGNLYAQRLNPTSVRLFQPGGTPLSTSSGNYKSHLQLTTDDAFGVVVLWNEFEGESIFVHTQRVSGAGEVLWSAGGVIVSAAGDKNILRHRSSMAADGDGNYIFTWGVDFNQSPIALKAQKVSSFGFIQWDNEGVDICTNPQSQPINPCMVKSDEDNVIIAWTDSRNAAVSSSNIYAARAGPDGLLISGPETYYITAGDGNWDDPTVWADNVVPPDGSNVIIRNNITGNVNANCTTLRVETPGSFTVNAGIQISISH